MHQILDPVWSECFRILKEGSFLCINIGDATRSINGEFAMYNNSMRITQACEALGFTPLPRISQLMPLINSWVAACFPAEPM